MSEVLFTKMGKTRRGKVWGEIKSSDIDNFFFYKFEVLSRYPMGMSSRQLGMYVVFRGEFWL